MYEPDLDLHQLLQAEQERQDRSIHLIPSENQCSQAVLDAVGSSLINKYSEGYAGRRYYEGNEIVDQIERLAQERAKELFKVPHANVQPYSGSPANSAAYMALAEPGSKILGLKLSSGGHLTHGQPNITFSGRYYQSIQYGLNTDARIDLDEVRSLAKQHMPKVMVIGTTAYPFSLPFREFAEIADEVGAYVLADISHIAGLVVTNQHESPVPYADVVMTTTHKTLRGPRGAILMVTERGVSKDEGLIEKIDKAVFPGMQGGPHNNTTAGIAVALHEASQPAFQEYGEQILQNATDLADSLKQQKIQLVGDGTENHLMIMDFSSFGGGTQMAWAMAQSGIIANKNTIPNEPHSPFYPSGVRIGTPWVTTLGMKKKEMQMIADWISRIHTLVLDERLPAERAERLPFLRSFKKKYTDHKELIAIRAEVAELRA